MKVAVTGANGHVGNVLVRMLAERGDEVRAVVHRSAGALEGLPVERVRADILDQESLCKAFAGVARVYHFAAIVSIVGDADGRLWRTNVDGVRRVMWAARECGVGRVVHCSSVQAFRRLPLAEPLDETRLHAPSTAPDYDRSKAAGEDEVRRAVDRGLDAVIVNPTGVVGPYDFEPSRMGQVFLRLAHRRLPTLVPGGFDCVDVRDVAAGAIAAGERGRTAESYLLSGRWRSVADIARTVERLSGVRAPRFTSPLWLAYLAAPFASAWAKARGQSPLFTAESLGALETSPPVSHDKARVELGYRPRPFADTVRDVLQWFARQGWTSPLAGSEGSGRINF